MGSVFIQINEEGIFVGDGEKTIKLKWAQFGPAKKQWLLHDLALLAAREVEEWNKDR